MDRDVLRSNGRVLQFQGVGLNVGNFMADFRSSRTDLRTGSGPCMLLLYVITWCLNNMQIVCCWCNALGNSKMDSWIVY